MTRFKNDEKTHPCAVATLCAFYASSIGARLLLSPVVLIVHALKN